jgi:phosphate transport system permease protein
MSKKKESLAIAAIVNKGLAKRKARERRFRLAGLAAIIVSLVFMVILIGSIVYTGLPAFTQTAVNLDFTYEPSLLAEGQKLDDEAIMAMDFHGLVKATLRNKFPSVTSRGDKKQLYELISNGTPYDLRDALIADKRLMGQTVSLWVLADDEVDSVVKGSKTIADSKLSEKQYGWIQQLIAEERVRTQFNWTFFENGDSREPELSGIRGAIMGSLFVVIVTLLLSFPMGVAAAIYLEEFATQNRWNDLIEININNLAAVPSIVFGLLGLAVYINFMGMPRSAPLVAGLVLTLMTLPTIIIASRAALKSVPPSLREAALGLGASKMQMIFHHVLPQAMPGMLTGSIIGMAQALGETAPLLMIGMVAFIVDIPQGFLDPATVLPVQIYLWADSPEQAFLERTAAAIMVLLVFLVIMNLLAIRLRKKFEKRW